MEIQRDPETCMKWCVSYEEYPGEYFPPYYKGLALAISGELIPEMYNASHYTKFLWVDDVFLTGLLTKDIQNITNIDINDGWDPERNFTSTRTLMVHPSNPYRLWNRLLKSLPVEQIVRTGEMRYGQLLEQSEVMRNKEDIRVRDWFKKMMNNVSVSPLW